MHISYWAVALFFFLGGLHSHPLNELVNMEANRDGKIVNGIPASAGEFPYMAVLYLNGYLCGGTLIGPSTILTAAHCLYGHTISEVGYFAVVLNSLSISGTDTGTIIKGVKNFTIHENYDPITMDNDVGLLLLNSSVTTLRFVSLPSDPSITTTVKPTTTKLITTAKTTTAKTTTTTTPKPTTTKTTTTPKPTTTTTPKPTTTKTTTTPKPTTTTTPKPTTTKTTTTPKPTTTTTPKPTTTKTTTTPKSTTTKSTTTKSTTTKLTTTQPTSTTTICPVLSDWASAADLLPLSNGFESKTAKAFSTYENSQAVITGWGTTSYGGSLSGVLLKADVVVQNNTLCTSQYGGDFIGADMLCASLPCTDTCQGDSGGPILVNGVQVGITSWGYGCADPNYAGIYTRVTTYLAWITARLV